MNQWTDTNGQSHQWTDTNGQWLEKNTSINVSTLRLTKVMRKLNLKLNGASSYQTGKDLIVNLLKQASYGEYISEIAKKERQNLMTVVKVRFVCFIHFQ